MKKIISKILFGFVLLLLSFFSMETKAQESTLIADVNIYNAEILEQIDNNLEISFLIKNGEKSQPDIRYGVQLFFVDENSEKTLVDEKVYPEKINLGENSTEEKTINYQAPAYLNGGFELSILSKNESGLMLAQNSLGFVDLRGDNQYIKIPSSSCFLAVDEDQTEMKYKIEEGVVLEPEENLRLTCDIVNNSKQDLLLNPVFETFERSTFGKKIAVKENSQKQSFNLKSSEKKTLSFIVPKGSEPQFYETKLHFENNSGIASNYLLMNYVIAGESITIQNLLLDKNSYKKGEIAEISLFTSDLNTNYLNSRIKIKQDKKVVAEIQVNDKNGKTCGEFLRTNLNQEKIKQIINFNIEKKCLTPQVKIELKSADDGRILDSAIYDFDYSGQSINEKQMKESNLILIISIILIIIISLFSGWFFYNKRKNSVIGIFLIGILPLVGFGFLKIEKTQASTHSLFYKIENPEWDSSWNAALEEDVTINISLDKEVYAPEERITATMNMSGSAVGYGDYYISTSGGGMFDRRTGGSASSKVSNFTAPSEPGTYQVSFKWEDRRYTEAQSGKGDFYDDVYYANGAVYANSIGFVYEFSDGSKTVSNWTPSLIKSAQSDMGYSSALDHYSKNGDWEGYMKTSYFSSVPSFEKTISFEVREGGSDTNNDNDGSVDDTDNSGNDSSNDISDENSLNYTVKGQSQSISMSGSLDKKTYSPEDMIAATMDMTGSAVSYGDYFISITGDSWWERKSGGGQSSKNSYFKAPTEPGTYQATFEWEDERYASAERGTGDYQLSDFGGDIPRLKEVINFQVSETSTGGDNYPNPSESTNQRPTATIIAPADGITIQLMDSINFSGEGTDPEGGEITAYSWHVKEPGANVYDSGKEWTRVFGNVGSYEACLSVKDDEGSWSANDACVNFTVSSEASPTSSGQPPIAVIDSPGSNLNFNIGEQVNYSGHGEDPDGDDIVKYEWRSGSCETGTVMSYFSNFNMAPFSMSHDYTYYLRVQDDDGNWSTNCPSVTIEVTNFPNVAFNTNQPEISLDSDSSFTLFWGAPNADSCYASNTAGISAWSGTKSNSGSKTIHPSYPGTETFTLTCSNSEGETTKTVTVKIGEDSSSNDDTTNDGDNQSSLSYSIKGQDQSIDLNVSLDKVNYTLGEKVVATMNMSDVTSGDVVSYGRGEVSSNYIETIVIRTGASNITKTFESPLAPGEYKIIFKWEDWRYLDAKNGKGEYSLNDFSGDIPSITKVINFEVGEGGTAEDDPGGDTGGINLPSISFSANQTEIPLDADSSFTLFWGAPNADSCYASNTAGISAWSGSKSNSGSRSIHPAYPGTETFTLTCSNEGGETTKTVTVKIGEDSSSNDDTTNDDNTQSSLSYSINGQDQSINWTVGLDKEVYAPGEEWIVATMNMSNAGSGDGVSYGDYYILITGNNWWERKRGATESSKTAYFKAPTEPGTYEAKFQWQDERYAQAINGYGDYKESDFSAVPSIVKVINFEVGEGGGVNDDVVDDTGDSDEQNQKPIATINSPGNNTTVSYGELINFSGSGNDPDGGSIMAYEWRDGSCDGYILDSNPSYKVSYWQAGTHNIYLKVQDNRGDWSTNCPSVAINVIEDEEGSKIDNGEPPVPYLEYAEENQYRKSEGETMSLKEGWNLVTFPSGEYSGAKINNNSATDLSEVRGELEIWKIEDQCSSSEGRGCFSVMPKREGYQELSSLEKNRNYWVYSDSSRSISFCGRTDQKCLIPISGSADNQPTERFSRGFNLINSTLLNYVLNYRSRFNFYVLDWDSDRSKWLVTNQDNQEVGGFERLRNILESKSYFMYIKESEDVDELNSLISR